MENTSLNQDITALLETIHYDIVQSQYASKRDMKYWTREQALRDVDDVFRELGSSLDNEEARITDSDEDIPAAIKSVFLRLPVLESLIELPPSKNSLLEKQNLNPSKQQGIAFFENHTEELATMYRKMTGKELDIQALQQEVQDGLDGKTPKGSVIPDEVKGADPQRKRNG